MHYSSRRLLSLFLPAFFLFLFQRGNAQQWQRANVALTEQMTALCVSGDTLFAAGVNRLYYTPDGGLTWSATAVIFPELDYIIAVKHIKNRIYVATVADGVYSSADGGESWQADNAGLSGLGALDISSLAVRGDSLYAGTYGAKVFVKKISANSAWTPYDAGLPWYNVESVTNIDGQLFAGSGANATLSRQSGPGHTWTETAFANFNGSSNSFLGVTRQGDVLLGAGTLGLYRSTDQGTNWTHYNPGTGVLASARFVVDGQRVIANLAKPVGTSFLKYTDDQGLTWQDVTPAAPNGIGYDIVLYKGQLYSARMDGLWRVALTTPTNEPLGFQATLGQNVPNPFTGSTTIPFMLAQKSKVELAIFAAVGSLVKTVWRGEKEAGSHTLTLETGDLPIGTYIYRLTTDFGTTSKQMVVAR